MAKKLLNWKRWLILIHRWLGVAMCLVFVLWFVSGIVMMYVGYPALTPAERFDTLPALDAGSLQTTPAAALAAVGVERPIQLRLSSIAGRPVWQIHDSWGRQHTVFADDSSVLTSVSPALAMETVRASGFMSSGASSSVETSSDGYAGNEALARETVPKQTLHHEGEVMMDQWSISGSLNAHRPLHLIALGDKAGTELYVSSRSGAIVLDTQRSERTWNWLGSTIHWIYPKVLRQHGQLWAQVIIWLSVLGLISILSGLVLGIMRLRPRRRYRGMHISPYRGVDKWHHISGLICVVFVLTFTFSGLMSMSPWGLFQSQSSAQQQLQAFQGAASLDLDSFPAWQADALPRGVKEVEWRMVGGQGYLLFWHSLAEQEVMTNSGVVKPGLGLTASDLRSLSADMIPAAEIARIDSLTRHDNYYYPRRDQHYPLPAYRVRFSDVENTWFDIDPASGRILARHTDASRLNRWLFNGLHSLDFRFLLERGILWDLTLIVLSLAGLLFSITSLMIGWRRLRQQF